MDRQRWAPIVDRFIDDLRAFEFGGRKLDVRENVKFFGGHFPKWIHKSFPLSVCVLSIEIKKIFMDEWSGYPDCTCISMIKEATTTKKNTARTDTKDRKGIDINDTPECTTTIKTIKRGESVCRALNVFK